MRDIKFRAWDKKHKRWIYVHLLDGQISWADPNYTSQGLAENSSGVVGICFNDIESWYQSTGLLDKNRKEIYEGDILSFVPVGSRKFKNPYEPFEVCWVKEQARFTDWDPRSEIEIIGNRFENPDLLG